jgi:hypothetical protein
LRAFKMSASWGYVGSPWTTGRDGVGKLSMSASGDWMELDVIFIGRSWLAPFFLQSLWSCVANALER